MPIFSKTRQLLQIARFCAQKAANPRKLGHYCSKCAGIVRERGLKGLLQTLQYRSAGRAGCYTQPRPHIPLPACTIEAPLPHPELPSFESITVSIIIPVYNQYRVTRSCLDSIIRHTKDVSYEVILADDNSSDQTRDIADVVKNLIVVKNPADRGFLNNCNHAAKHARGTYVLFLNNDTIVTDGWLWELVRTMEADPQIGLVGPKFLADTGAVMEAGGIVFRDASAWNYGRGMHPEMPGVCYPREVDYISGACILLKTALWNELGGFDATFAPCYYEDTDLAFRVRYEKGLKVLYQPKSVIYHMEGVSNGTNESTGFKRYQVVNREKFYQKWRTQLHQCHTRGADELFLAKDHAKTRRTMLVIDYGLLSYAEDTGSRSTFQYLRYFAGKGYNTKFLPNDPTVNRKYLQSHCDLGVEVVESEDLHQWFVDNGRHIDFAYVNRPDVCDAYLGLLHKYSNATVIYQGHDLHHLREYREDMLKHLPNAEKKMQARKAFELGVCERADVACYFSDTEVQLVNSESHANAVKVPLFILKAAGMQKYQYTPESRNDIAFVGGYNHPPNVDGAQWFIEEILPHCPGIKFYVVGSNPPKSLCKLASENVIVTGTISEEALENIYASIRLAVVPLRYGAGVKGKIIEAIYHKVPVVTTTIGIEGIANDSGLVTVADEPADFARETVRLYNDAQLLLEKSRLSETFIREHFSDTAVNTALGPYMPELLQ
ncbi:MAG: glycosyltransferase [Desulfovibrio sp.]|nr:glycosyltransferase [Desulfovibrio sp.]